MLKTLSQILVDVNSYIDLTAELPTGDDLDARQNFAQQAVEEWSNAYRWRQLGKSTDYFATGATHTLEQNFRELTSPPRQGNSFEFPEVQRSELFNKNSGDKFSIVNTDYMVGSTLILQGFPVSGATISYSWQRFPSNMSTLTSICEVPDPEFVKLKIISYVLQSRLDERFPTVEARANLILQNMIGREMITRPGGSLSIPRYGTAAWRLGSRNG